MRRSRSATARAVSSSPPPGVSVIRSSSAHARGGGGDRLGHLSHTRDVAQVGHRGRDGVAHLQVAGGPPVHDRGKYHGLRPSLAQQDKAAVGLTARNQSDIGLKPLEHPHADGEAASDDDQPRRDDKRGTADRHTRHPTQHRNPPRHRIGRLDARPAAGPAERR
jgi:hypothetical protein